VVGAGNGNGPFSGGTLMPSDANANETQLQQILSAVASNKAQSAAQHQTLADLQREIVAAANHLGLGGDVRTKQLNNGLQVTLLTDQVLFASGHADLQPQGLPLLSVIARILQSVDNSIDINGYTDNVPIGPGGQFPSNLYLSSFRADAVADYFASIGIGRSRLFPAGRGDQDFIATNATAAGRAENRRVEIIVESKLVKQTLEQAGLNSKAVTPSTLPIAPINGTSAGASPDLNPNLAGH
jgi:chemotaxis protein MotB